jgi:hypothetical protein
MESMRIFATAIVKRTDASCGSQRGSDAGSRKCFLRICPSFKRNVYGAPRINQYALYANEELSPRVSVWLYLSVVSIACLSSYLITEKYINVETMEGASDNGSNSNRTFIDTVLISILSISFVLSFLIAVIYHHRDIREKITKDIPLVHNSLEFFVTILLFGFWCAVLRYVSDPFSEILSASIIDVHEGNVNTNIWVCTWIGFGLTSYLVGSLIMASPVRKRGVVFTRGYTDGPQLSARQGDVSRSDCPKFLATDTRRGEDDVVYWFMLLAFSSALAGFSISTRVGDTCASSDLSASAFCKRSSLGGATGIMCALLAFAALLLYRMDKGGTFDAWGPKRKFVVLRINAMLAGLTLVLQSVNVGFGTNTTGPSTDINNTYIASMMGIILSLMLCEQAKSKSVLRLMPPPSLRTENEAEATNLRGDDLCNVDEYAPSFSSSSHASSSSSPSSGESFESSSECAVVVATPNVVDQRNGAIDVENGINKSSCNSSHRDYLPCHANSMSEIANASSSSSGCSSSKSSSNDPSSKSTFSTYTLPQPPPTYSPSSSPPQPMNSFANAPYPPNLSYKIHTEDTQSGIQQTATDDDSSSYIELSFQPDDDVSSIGFSAIPGDKFGKEPDGYKYDDLYTPSEDPMVDSSILIASRDKWRHLAASQHNNHSALAPVSENTALTEPCSTSTHHRKVEEIMNRCIDKPTNPYADPSDRSSTDSDSSNHDGPPTVNSIGNSIGEI